MTSSRLRELFAERLPEVPPERGELVIAAASALSDRVLRDGHLARSEQQKIRRSLKDDFSEAEIDWILEALATEPARLRAEAKEAWRTLGYWLLGPSAARHSPGESEVAQHARAELAVRWPMHVDEGVPLRTHTLEATREGIQVDRPSSLASLFVRWRDLVTLEPVEPWPEILLEWEEGAALRRARVGPSGDPTRFDAAVEALVAAAEQRVPHDRLPTGWLRDSKAAWEKVEELPRASPEELAGAARTSAPTYRTGPDGRDAVVAVRPPRGGLGVMLEWLASGPERPFREGVREAVLTERYLYVRRRSGEAARIALEQLTDGRGGKDRVYRFGRNTTVLLTDGAECAVCAGLDARIEARARAARLDASDDDNDR